MSLMKLTGFDPELAVCPGERSAMQASARNAATVGQRETHDMGEPTPECEERGKCGAFRHGHESNHSSENSHERACEVSRTPKPGRPVAFSGLGRREFSISWHEEPQQGRTVLHNVASEIARATGHPAHLTDCHPGSPPVGFGRTFQNT